MVQPVLLIADDEYAARHAMKKALGKKSYQLLEAENGQQALEVIQSNPIDLVFLDINMPEKDGFAVLEELQNMEDPPLVVMITAYGDEKVAVKAMKMGAYDYIRKPPELDELRLIAKKAIHAIRLTRENKRLKKKLSWSQGMGEIIGESEIMKKLFERVRKISQTNVTVLIQGESGTGKELFSKEIHRLSSRKNNAFIAVNCAALPDSLIENELFGHEKGAYTGAQTSQMGKFEMAHNGTLFLDEIGDMNSSTQAKVLRALEEKRFERLGGTESIKVDVRVIAATNKNLKEMVQSGEFREDLYYRLNVMDFYLPSLREKKEDIPLLAEKFIQMFSIKHDKEISGISQDGLMALMKYDWPGNVRELRNLLEKAMILCDGSEFKASDLPEEILQSSGSNSKFLVAKNSSFKEAKKLIVEKFEREFIESKLKDCKGNISKAARELDMHRQSLQNKLKELQINSNKFKRES